MRSLFGVGSEATLWWSCSGSTALQCGWWEVEGGGVWGGVISLLTGRPTKPLNLQLIPSAAPWGLDQEL